MESSLEFSSSLGSVSSLLTRCRTFKVLVIGDSGVGKTCLTHRLCAGEFPSRVEATIGVDFRERQLDVDGEKLKVTGAAHASLGTGGEQVQCARRCAKRPLLRTVVILQPVLFFFCFRILINWLLIRGLVVFRLYVSHLDFSQ